ncbi:uncharacterized protein EV420DRAFT_1650865 [Desarmillaria tabescens]|uniref:Uncharacterized protein n=1 Tax=Armillaria tabescens TaxID=1929756 RepID=A0AA39JB35_ARMTA|nr:uncharacterized protein EV420DRAFT_1650865 [Desarmillaria tabescens]KAK0439507.1 hypothetical protein EV420DRAFT_1650865 [Desarmillaria tabescens]
MLKALLLCNNPVYIGISVDGQRSRVKHKDNVITKLLENLKHWPFLEQLDIDAAIPIHPADRVSVPSHKPPLRDVCIQIIRCITAFQCRDPTPQMLKVQIATDFIIDFQLRKNLESQHYSFMSRHISDAARRVIKETRNLADIGRVSEDE